MYSPNISTKQTSFTPSPPVVLEDCENFIFTQLQSPVSHSHPHLLSVSAVAVAATFLACTAAKPPCKQIFSYNLHPDFNYEFSALCLWVIHGKIGYVLVVTLPLVPSLVLFTALNWCTFMKYGHAALRVSFHYGAHPRVTLHSNTIAAHHRALLP